MFGWFSEKDQITYEDYVNFIHLRQFFFHKDMTNDQIDNLYLLFIRIMKEDKEHLALVEKDIREFQLQQDPNEKYKKQKKPNPILLYITKVENRIEVLITRGTQQRKRTWEVASI